MIWVSIRLRPILSPPGLGMNDLLNRASKGPAIMTEPRNLLAILWNSGSSILSIRIFFALNKKVSSDSFCTVTPNSFKISINNFTSRILGILLILTGSSVNKTAQITCNASFLAP